MYRVDLYARVRRACRVEGMSTREASRVFGLDARRYARCCRSRCRRGIAAASRHGGRSWVRSRGSSIGFWKTIGPATTSNGHTAKRIFDRLRDEYGFTGGYTIVKDYVRERRLRSREMFVPLVHSPGHAQADFGEAMAVIGGVARKVHFLAFDLPTVMPAS